MEERYVLAVDVGTSIIRCHVYDRLANVVGSARERTRVIYPQVGWVEIEPETLWKSFIGVIKGAIHDAHIDPQQVSCLGIATMRNVFITWDKETGEPFHNFISWNDLRAVDLVNSWNSSFTMMGIRLGAKIIYGLTHQSRYLAASVIQLANKQVGVRLLWALNNIPTLRRRAAENKVLYGTLDTWLLWKLTGGVCHMTDYSCASSSALYDPFIMEWGMWMFNLFKIPISMMPELKDTSGIFGTCSAEFFGAPIPVSAMAGDQQAATFGQCCFQTGDVKCSMGTGSFIDINTGIKPHASINGLYPLIGWKYGSHIVYLAEGSSNDTGTAITFAQSIGVLENPEQSSEIAHSVEDSGGVCFIPGFSGLQAPINDDHACAGLLGIKPCTSKAEIVRAVLESLAYRIKQLYEVIDAETEFSLNSIRVDGGVSKNDFILQLISNLTGQTIYRSDDSDMTCQGIAFLAGLSVGIWKNEDDLKALRKPNHIFTPQSITDAQKRSLAEWQRAVGRFLHWYKS